MQRHATLLLLLLPVPLVSLALAGEPEPVRFLRCHDGVEGTAGALETAQASYTSSSTRTEVVLYSTVHMGESGYFEKMKKDLAGFDAVLFEGIPSGSDSDDGEGAKLLAELQATLGKVLHLVEQTSAIDYGAKNFVHADMSFEALLAAAKGDLGTILPGGRPGMLADPRFVATMRPRLEKLKADADRFPDELRDRIKRAMARQMAADLGAIGGETERVLVGERDQVCLAVLDAELAKRSSGRVAILFGVGHMADLDRRLAARGWKRGDLSWSAAWTFAVPAAAAEARPPTKPASDRLPEPPPGHRWRRGARRFPPG
jgi:hypothetical protein